MIKLIFKHYKNEKYVYSADASISYGKTEDTLVFQNSALDGCVVSICKKSIYRSPLCYLNIINPFLFLWWYKTPPAPEDKFNRVLDRYKLQLSSLTDGDCLVFMFSESEGKVRFNCLEGAERAGIKVTKNLVESKTQKKVCCYQHRQRLALGDRDNAFSAVSRYGF